MEQYDQVASDLSRHLALSYSTSFGSASKLYSPGIRQHIFNIYGWVRVADELVDTYRGNNCKQLLDQFRKDTYQALKDNYSPNPIIHAFALTANLFGIGKKLIDPFLGSMAMDSEPSLKLTQAQFDTYVYGSAQVVGLMCLRVFVDSNETEYEHLRPGAEALGAAFQKVNFLRDFATDTKRLGRHYFPQLKNGRLTEATKHAIIGDIRHDLTHALPALMQLPNSSRAAVMAAARYYNDLLDRLEATPAATIAIRRIRVPDWRKKQILASVRTSHTLKRSAS